MANVVARGTASSVSGNLVILDGPSLLTLNPPTSCYVTPLVAGEALKPGAVCHISPVDGLVYNSFGGGATAYAVGPLGLEPTGYTDASLAQVDGWNIEQVFGAGEAVGLMTDVLMNWCNVAQTAAKKLYVSGTVIGGLDDAASTNGTAFVAKVQGESPVATTSTKIKCKLSAY